MTIGPGKYDDVCTLVREKTDAEMVIVIVVGGNRGEGFSVQTTDPRMLVTVPAVLEHVAQQIRKDGVFAS